MAKNVLGSSNTYTGDGATTIFSINFAIGVITTGQIKVYVDDVLKALTTDYTLINSDSQVQFVTAPASNTVIDIRREQDDNALEVDYQDKKQVKEKNLDSSNKALYYLLHELFDGWLGNRFKLRKNLDANNKKVINLKDASDDQDAVNLRIAKGLLATIPVADAVNKFTLSFLGSAYTVDNLNYDLSGVLTADITQSSIYINGVKQVGGNAYTATGKIITFTELVLDTDLLEVHVNLNTIITQPVITVKTVATATSTAGQTLFTAPTYITGKEDLLVFVNGVYQPSPNYTETDSTSITFSVGLNDGDEVYIKRIQ